LNSLTRLTGLGSVEQQFSRKPRPAGRWDRPELRRMLDQLREDDVVAVWKLDGRSAP
jgi:DNA invertase Pin-like site-specific DNA recombinase